MNTHTSLPIARRSGHKAAAGTFVAALAAAALIPGTAFAAFRAGDVGFSIKTDAGQTWVYGDSWNNGSFIRNAFTLDGNFVRTVKGTGVLPAANWIWPGAPIRMDNGDIAMYGAEVAQVKGSTGIWAFQVVGGVRAQFPPGASGASVVSKMPKGSQLWSAAAAVDPASGNRYVYGVDANHHAKVGQVNADGTVTSIQTMGGTISGQFSVLQDPADGKWWMVGNLPFLSRRVVAYPLSGPAGKVTGAGLKLITLPSPGTTRYVYAATVHPEINGLLTWAVNGTGAGTPYGIQRQADFWPLSLHFAKAAAGMPVKAVAGAASVRGRVAIAATSGDTVKLWDSSRQGELQDQMDAEAEMDSTETWLGNAPGDLTVGQSPLATAPAVWEFGSATKTPKKPEGEDDDKASSSFLVPANAAAFAAQQAAAKAALVAAKDAAAAATAQLKAAINAASLAEQQAEAMKDAAEALSEKDRKAAEKKAEQLKKDAEKAKDAADKALEKANKAVEKAQAALDKANGKGRSSWGLL